MVVVIFYFSNFKYLMYRYVELFSTSKRVDLWLLRLLLLKGNSHQKLSEVNIIELLLKSCLVYHSPMFEAWKVPKRPVEVTRVPSHSTWWRGGLP